MEEITRLSIRGTITLPASLRRELGLTQGQVLTVKRSGRSIVLTPIELYDGQRIAEFEDSSRLTKDQLSDAKQQWTGEAS